MTTTYEQGQQLWAWTDPTNPEGLHYLAASRDEAIAGAEEELDTREAIAVCPATAPRYAFDGEHYLAWILADGEEAAADDPDLLQLDGEDAWHALPGAAEALETALAAWAETYLRVATARIDLSAREIVRKDTWAETKSGT